MNKVVVETVEDAMERSRSKITVESGDRVLHRYFESFTADGMLDHSIDMFGKKWAVVEINSSRELGVFKFLAVLHELSPIR